jgi:hypothetical protein
LQYETVTIQRKSSNWFTNLLRLYPTKKYEALTVEWDVAGSGSGSGAGTRNRGEEGGTDEIVAVAAAIGAAGGGVGGSGE